MALKLTTVALPLQAAQYPFWGIWGPYNASRNPWANPDVRAYMLYYVNQTSNYLLQVRKRSLRGQGAQAVQAGSHPLLAYACPHGLDLG